MTEKWQDYLVTFSPSEKAKFLANSSNINKQKVFVHTAINPETFRMLGRLISIFSLFTPYQSVTRKNADIIICDEKCDECRNSHTEILTVIEFFGTLQECSIE